MEERRKSKRLELLGKLIIKPLSGASQPESVTIEIVNCSRHGLGFDCDRQLTLGDNYEAYLTIWTKEVLHVFIQIVRGEKSDVGFNYGSIFIGMPEAERQRISVYETVEDFKDEA